MNQPRPAAATRESSFEPSPTVAWRALDHFAVAMPATLAAFGRGLINQTYRVATSDGEYVLQCVNRIFDPAIHANIEVVTRRLVAADMSTPRLVPTVGGNLWADLGPDGIWRLATLVPGVSFDTVQSSAQAFEAGALVGRFHRALLGLAHPFVGLRVGVHDTARHLAALRDAMVAHPSHRLHSPVSTLGHAILDAAAELAPLPVSARTLVGHGDLKLNNVLFAGAHPPARDKPVALVDLDTVGPVVLAHELGDAWRSWCNPAGEDSDAACFELPIFEHAWRGYETVMGDELTLEDRRALLLGPDWISLELAARFAADALVESYFGWDPSKHPARGEHNLARACSQWAVHRAVASCRGERARLLGVTVR